MSYAPRLARRRALAVAFALSIGYWTVGTDAQPAAAAPRWSALFQPTAGDVRSLAVQPGPQGGVFLGTADGVLYRSTDEGTSWRRLEPGLGQRGVSLDDLLVDARGRLWVGFWKVQGGGGGVARSDDGGHTFTTFADLSGVPVRGLDVSASNPDVAVAGTQVGVFRSEDSGATWRRISPEGHADLKNVGSIAIDDLDPSIVYAGTWHLPWKTLDAGATWQPTHAGMIDDSDVMTLTLDRRSRASVYATACSGIYRSVDGARRWSKVPGIPGTSRRTRAFAQDQGQLATFYAGTTGGLWRSRDDLKSWTLATARELVVNAIATLPSGTLLIGTDGAGVLRSVDRGQTFAPSNRGFAEPFVARVLFDGPGVVVGLLGDRQHSGVLYAPHLGADFARIASGLEGRELLALAAVPSGSGGASAPVPRRDPLPVWSGGSGGKAGSPSSSLLAGTDAGLFLLGNPDWRRLVTVVDGLDIQPRVVSVAAVNARTFLAATAEGLLHTTDGGATWQRRELGPARAVTAVAVAPTAPSTVLASTSLGIFRSDDGGRSFVQVAPQPLEVPLTSLQFLPGPARRVVGTSTRGLVLSNDEGASWMRRGGGLPLGQVTAVTATPDGQTLFASDFTYGGVYVSRDAGLSWSPLPREGLASERVFALAIEPGPEGRLVAAPTSGGLHVFAP